MLLLAVVAALAWHLGRPRSFAEDMRAFLREEGIGGAVVAYGPVGGAPVAVAFGEAAPGRAMRVGDRFRLASLSKPITAAAALHLVREGRITLDTPVAEAGRGIALRHLLEHSGGWDREKTFDPISDPPSAARIGLVLPYRCEDVAAHMPPAQFRPGTHHAYSNIGYCRLGQVIARVSGMSYARYVEQAVLAPRGAHLIYEGAPTVRHATHWPDAAFAALGPGGGWTGSAMEYWRFAAGPMDPRVAERPGYARPGEAYYGLGWRIWPDGTFSHFGAIEGVYGVVFRAHGHVAVLLFNGRPRKDAEAFARLRRAARKIGI